MSGSGHEIKAVLSLGPLIKPGSFSGGHLMAVKPSCKEKRIFRSFTRINEKTLCLK